MKTVLMLGHKIDGDYWGYFDSVEEAEKYAKTNEIVNGYMIKEASIEYVEGYDGIRDDDGN